jgi:hypothetical protein
MANDDSNRLPCGAFEKLTLHYETPVDTHDVAGSSLETKPNIILCDAWYGFPEQRRPRKERICAVSRQLVNFLQWRQSAKLGAEQCQVHLLGSEVDVTSVQQRIVEIVEKEDTSGNCISQIDYKPNVDIHEAIERWKNSYSTNEEVVYLSPDASETLSPTARPPNVVIVGMLIDRRITSDRSRKRAEESLNLRAVKLPLDELDVKEMCSQEPLNVDTVMELMQRWWINCDELEEIRLASSEKICADPSKYREGFIRAAAFAIKSHRERHPNRTIHKS